MAAYTIQWIGGGELVKHKGKWETTGKRWKIKMSESNAAYRRHHLFCVGKVPDDASHSVKAGALGVHAARLAGDGIVHIRLGPHSKILFLKLVV